MRHLKKSLLSLMLIAAMLLSACGSFGASGDKAEAEASAEAGALAGAEESSASEEGETEASDGTEGEDVSGYEVSGYTLLSSKESDLLQSELLTYKHDKSGATLVCIDNDDPELAFGIFYNTPVVDETDTNHVFEHAIIASSEKYPSHDLFFDLSNKSYNTFTNAFTYDTFTGYPLSSMNEEQLIKLMDAYLSCMVAPDILTNENIFKREAIRYELTAPEDEISINGTVYAEDFASLTDTVTEAFNNTRDALYPGEISANLIGRAHRNYERLTYEHAIETYDRCYSFDNSLILLYGDMDFEHVMSFIDEEYLSKAEDKGTDLSQYFNEETEPGFVERVVESPAYEGDMSEDVSIIDYAMSISDMDWKDIIGLDIISKVLMQESSGFMQSLRAQGIQNELEIGVDYFAQKPYFMFRLYNADESQAGTFKEAVDKALSDMAGQGVEEEILDSVLKQIEISNYQIRDRQNAGVNLFPDMVNYWIHTGETDYYGLYEETLSGLLEDESQAKIKELADALISSQRSSLVTTVPTPGLAEELIAERDKYLSDMKASMSEEEIAELIADTKAFNEWNENMDSNSDFIIDPSELEDYELPASFEKTEEDGITYYEAEASVDKIGSFAVYFDASALDEEELHYLNLYTMLISELPTSEHSEAELMNSVNEYLVDFSTDAVYPDGPKAGDAHPMISFSWTSLTEDHEEGLKLLLELLSDTKIDDGAAINDILERNMDSFDLSRNADFLYLARDIAGSGFSKEYAYKRLFSDQDFYYFLKDVSSRLSEDEGYAAELSKRLSEVRDKLITRQGLIYVCAASEEELSELKKEAKAILSELPEGEAKEPTIVFEELPKRLGVAVESPSQYSVFMGNMYGDSELYGRYLPYVIALSDKYLIPTIRFQNGAYSASAGFNTSSGSVMFYAYSDPHVGRTIEVFDGAADFLRSLELNEEELDGYILNAFSYSPFISGVLSGAMDIMEKDIKGYDLKKAVETMNDIKNSSLSDKEKTADVLEDIMAEGYICTVGNEASLKADEDYFNELISYRAGSEE